MLVWVLKIFGGIFLVISIILSGAYIYISSQTGKPQIKHPFFSGFSKRPLVMSHRGGAAIFPENTLFAFQESWKLGVDVLELDIWELADGNLVVFHDKTVNRTTNGEGNISEKTLADVKKLNAAYRFTRDGGQTFPLREKNISVPTLEEVFKALPQAKFNIELKPSTPTIAASLCRQIREHKLSEKVIVASVSQSNLDNFRGECPEIVTSASFSEVLSFFSYYKIGLSENYSPKMFSLQTLKRLFGMQVVSKEFVEAAHKLNLEVHVWTINNADDMQKLVEIGVDGIMTDYPDKLIEIRNKMQL